MKESKAPVVVALCQVRFTRIGGLASYIDEIQEVLRKNHELHEFLEHDQIIHYEVDKGNGNVERSKKIEKLWEFLNLSRSVSLILSKDFLTLVCSKHGYAEIDKWEGFSELLVSALEIVDNAVSLGFVTRIGMRYIDLVVDSEESNVRCVLNPGVMEGLKLSEAMNACNNQFEAYVHEMNLQDGSILRIQCRIARNQPILQGVSVQSLHLGEDVPMIQKEEFLCVDFDNFKDYQPAKKFTRSEIHECIRLLHSNHRRVFRKIFNYSDDEMEAWS